MKFQASSLTVVRVACRVHRLKLLALLNTVHLPCFMCISGVRSTDFVAFCRSTQGLRVDFGKHLRPPKIFIIVLEHQFRSFFVQSRLWEGLNEKATNHHQNMSEAMGRLPVFLQGVDAYFSTRLANVWMEDFSQEETCANQNFAWKALHS